MSAKIIDGTARANRLCEQVKKGIADFTAKTGRRPGLAVILVGEDPASNIYVRSKEKRASETGIYSLIKRLPADSSQAEILALVDELNKNDAIDGILLQLPLPGSINPKIVLDRILPEKDVDGFHIVNVGKLASGREAMVPCTPLGCCILLDEQIGDLSGLSALVIGRSNIVGKPMAQLLLKRNATVTIAHSRSKNLPRLCADADILVAAIGQAEKIRGDWIKPGATVIDVGINRLQSETPGERGKLVGDVAFAEAQKIAGAITPVPGGVGPMTVACLMANTLTAAARRNNVNEANFITR